MCLLQSINRDGGRCARMLLAANSPFQATGLARIDKKIIVAHISNFFSQGEKQASQRLIYCFRMLFWHVVSHPVNDDHLFVPKKDQTTSLSHGSKHEHERRHCSTLQANSYRNFTCVTNMVAPTLKFRQRSLIAFFFYLACALAVSLLCVFWSWATSMSRQHFGLKKFGVQNSLKLVGGDMMFGRRPMILAASSISNTTAEGRIPILSQILVVPIFPVLINLRNWSTRLIIYN